MLLPRGGSPYRRKQYQRGPVWSARSATLISSRNAWASLPLTEYRLVEFPITEWLHPSLPLPLEPGTVGLQWSRRKCVWATGTLLPCASQPFIVEGDAWAWAHKPTRVSEGPASSRCWVWELPFWSFGMVWTTGAPCLSFRIRKPVAIVQRSPQRVL